MCRRWAGCRCASWCRLQNGSRHSPSSRGCVSASDTGERPYEGIGGRRVSGEIRFRTPDGLQARAGNSGTGRADCGGYRAVRWLLTVHLAGRAGASREAASGQADRVHDQACAGRRRNGAGRPQPLCSAGREMAPVLCGLGCPAPGDTGAPQADDLHLRASRNSSSLNPRTRPATTSSMPPTARAI